MHGNETTVLEHMTLTQSYTLHVTRKTKNSSESHQTLYTRCNIDSLSVIACSTRHRLTQMIQ